MHTEQHEDVFQIVYWKGNAAADRNSADRAELLYFVKNCGWCPLRSFELPKEAMTLEIHSRALMRVYEAGKRARSRELLAILREGGGHV